MLSTRGFHHVTMVTSDAARAVRFYRDVLGLGLVKRTVDHEEPTSWHLYFGDAAGAPGTLLTFLERRGAGPGRPGAGGVHHVALGVETAEAQLRWKRWLQDRGVPVSGPFDRGWFRSIYFADPDGQILEIATAGPGYAVDEPADALGSGVVVPPTAELRGARNELEIRARTHPEPVHALTPEMRLTGIHHVSGLTDDVGEIGEFYEAALGLRLVKRSVNQDDPSMPHWFWASYDGRTVEPHSSLTMFGGWSAGGMRLHGRLHRVRPGAGQVHHIAFRARDAEQLDEWAEHLRTLGVEPSQVLDRGYFHAVHFRAPDGLLFALATDGPGVGVDEPAGALGRTLKLPHWLEPERGRLEASLHPLEEVRTMTDVPTITAWESHVPEGAADGVPVVVLLHGRGADRTDLFGLHRHLPAEWAVLAPDAPFRGAPWGYGPGRAWYRYMGRNRPDPDSYAQSLKAIDDFIDRIPSIIGHRPGPIVLGGFSQGGTTSVGYALAHPGRVRHVINFSGFLADHPAVDPGAAPESGARFFWGHGVHDPSIPFALALEGRDLLRTSGADLETRDYEIGHWIDGQEVTDAVAWLQRGLEQDAQPAHRG